MMTVSMTAAHIGQAFRRQGSENSVITFRSSKKIKQVKVMVTKLTNELSKYMIATNMIRHA